MGLPDRVVDIEVGHRLGTGHQARHPPGEPGQQAGGDRVELTDVTEGVGPQMRTQRGRGPARGEEPAHATVAQQPHVDDAVGPGDHARHQCRDLRGRVGTGRARHRETVRDELVQTGLFGQAHHREKPGRGHEIGIIEISRKAMRDSHYRVLLSWVMWNLRKSHHPWSQEHSSVTAHHRAPQQRRIQAESGAYASTLKITWDC